MAETVNGTLFAAAALGFLKKVALGTTIIPFQETIPATSTDAIGDRYRLLPMYARGGRNRLVAILFQCAALDSDGALRAKLVVNQNGADTDCEAAANYGAARSLTLLIPLITLDDTEGDYEATLDLLVTVAGTSADAGVLEGLAFYE